MLDTKASSGVECLILNKKGELWTEILQTSGKNVQELIDEDFQVHLRTEGYNKVGK